MIESSHPVIHPRFRSSKFLHYPMSDPIFYRSVACMFQYFTDQWRVCSSILQISGVYVPVFYRSVACMFQYFTDQWRVCSSILQISGVYVPVFYRSVACMFQYFTDQWRVCSSILQISGVYVPLFYRSVAITYQVKLEMEIFSSKDQEYQQNERLQLLEHEQSYDWRSQ